MKEKEKAKELVSIYWNAKVETPHVRESIMSKELAIQCALIAVDIILNDIMFWWFAPNKESTTGDMIYFITQKTYWKKVKKEIEKL